jgi:hypothetical protein
MATTKTELKHAHAGRAIFTQYHAPTNRLGARVRAWLAGDEDKRPNFVHQWDYETEGQGNATQAALKLLTFLRAEGYHRPKKATAVVSTYLGDGRYCFAFCTDADAEEAKTVSIIENTEQETSPNA